MKFSKKTYLFFLSFLSSGGYFASTAHAMMEDHFEERTFPSSTIKGVKIRTDTGNISIGLSGEEESKIQFKKISGAGEIRVTLTDGELNIDSTNPPAGGCCVDYRAYVPQGTPISITTGKANISVENMGDINVTAGALSLRARNIFGSVNLQYSSGEAEIRYDGLPPYPYTATINSSSGRTAFFLPPESTVKLTAARPQLVESEFANSLKSHFSFIFNSSSGRLSLKKNLAAGFEL